MVTSCKEKTRKTFCCVENLLLYVKATNCGVSGGS